MMVSQSARMLLLVLLEYGTYYLGYPKRGHNFDNYADMGSLMPLYAAKTIV